MPPASPEPRAARRQRAGFALPLALFMLTVMALFAALLLESSLHELRIGRGDLAGARAEAAAESALGEFFATHPDSSVLVRPRGAASTSINAAGADTARLVVQSLGNGWFRLAAFGRSWAGGVRADAGSAAFVRLLSDSGGPPGSLRFRRLPDWWWTQIP